MEILILAALLGLIPASIAKNKGRSFGEWWFFGALLFIIALPMALMMKPNRAGIEKAQRSEGQKKCPFCAEMIKQEAVICRYCGKSQVEAKPEPVAAAAAPERRLLFLGVDGVALGPFTPEDVERYLREGRTTLETPCCIEGQDWKTVRDFAT